MLTACTPNHTSCKHSGSGTLPRKTLFSVRTDYNSEILEWMLLIERKLLPRTDYMSIQREITFDMRQTLFLWLIQVQQEFRLKQDTLYLTFNIIDRVGSRAYVPKIHYQLLGIAALWVASKYEENHGRVPSLKRLCIVSCHSYSQEQILWSENFILKEIGFKLGYISPEHFLTAFSEQDVGRLSSREHALARFIIEISAICKDLVSVKPSTVALSSLYLARHIIRPSHILPREKEVQLCIDILHMCISDVPQPISQKVTKTNKYSTPHHCYASQVVANYCSTYTGYGGMQTPPRELGLRSQYHDDEFELNFTDCFNYPDIFTKLLSDRWGI